MQANIPNQNTPTPRDDPLPFRYAPEDAGMPGGSASKSVFAERPDLLLRTNHFDLSEQDIITTVAQRMRAELEEFPKFGINLPPMRLVVGDKTKVHNVTYRIDGVTLEELLGQGVDDDALAQIQDLLVHQSEYLAAKYKKKEPIVDDVFGLHQYMYGMLPGETRPAIYMHDIDFFSHVGTDNPRLSGRERELRYNEIVLVELGKMAGDIRLTEAATGRSLDVPRKKLYETMAILPDEEFEAYRKELIHDKLTLPWEEAQEIEIC